MRRRLMNGSMLAGGSGGNSRLATWGAAGRRRVFFVAIQPELSPPVFHGEDVFERVRVTLMEPPDAWFGRGAETDTLALGSDSAALAAPAMPLDSATCPRLVRGEVLRGPDGRLFEKLGHEIRPLHRLVSGPLGELMDWAPPEVPPQPNQRATQSAAPSDAGSKHGTANGHSATESGTPNGRVAESSAGPPENSSAAGYRALLPEPGLRRLVPWGNFKDMLAGQLAHPDRLQDSHRLAVHVQVYEVTVPQRLDSLAAAITGDARQVHQLRSLTGAVAAMLELPAAVVPPAPARGRREPGLMLPRDRVFRLQLASDPTSDRHTESAVPSALSRFDPHPGSSPPGGHPSAVRREIPERFLKPWEFRFSREEVVYDMNLSLGGSLASLVRRIKNWLTRRGEFRKWRVLLCGRSLDEQLWEVRPPRGALSHRSVRQWARTTLELAGYDASRMLLEWEVFWRRKGL